MKEKLLVLFFFCLLFSVQASNSKVDVTALKSKYLSHYSKADYLEANEVLNELRDHFYQLGDSNELVNCLIKQADIYRATKQFSIAHSELAVLLESTFDLTPLQLVETYSLQGAISYEERDFASMLVFTEQAVELARQYNIEERLPGLYNLLGRYYVDVDRELAYRYLQYSIDGFLELNQASGAILPQIHYARLKIQDEDYEEAFAQLDKVMKVLDTLDIMVYRQMTVGLYKNAYEQKGDYKNALVYASEADSLHKEMVGNLARATAFHKKNLRSTVWSDLQAENIALRNELKKSKEGYTVYWFIVGIVFLVLVVILWMANKKRELRKQLAQDKVRLEEKLTKRSKELASKRHHTITKANNLQELNEFKTKVLSILGHDLRGPIAQLITYQQAKEGGVEFSPEELVQMDKVILAGAQNSLLVLDNLLKWASEGSTLEDEKDTLVNMSFMINHVVNQFKLSARQKGVSLEVGDVDFEISSKESLLKLIIRNLVSNAVKYSDSGDEVKVYVKQQSNKLLVIVSDTGKGISEDILTAIRSTKSNIKPTPGSMGERGIGLGIQLSTQFAKHVHGVISFEKNTPKGTIACLAIPIG